MLPTIRSRKRKAAKRRRTWLIGGVVFTVSLALASTPNPPAVSPIPTPRALPAPLLLGLTDTIYLVSRAAVTALPINFPGRLEGMIDQIGTWGTDIGPKPPFTTADNRSAG